MPCIAVQLGICCRKYITISKICDDCQSGQLIGQCDYTQKGLLVLLTKEVHTLLLHLQNVFMCLCQWIRVNEAVESELVPMENTSREASCWPNYNESLIESMRVIINWLSEDNVSQGTMSFDLLCCPGFDHLWCCRQCCEINKHFGANNGSLSVVVARWKSDIGLRFNGKLNQWRTNNVGHLSQWCWFSSSWPLEQVAICNTALWLRGQRREVSVEGSASRCRRRDVSIERSASRCRRRDVSIEMSASRCQHREVSVELSVSTFLTTGVLNRERNDFIKGMNNFSRAAILCACGFVLGEGDTLHITGQAEV